jgi:serine/threonine protein kinase
MGMQWPPYTTAQLQADRGREEPGVSEAAPLSKPKYWPLVHFDLDPQNVLIGDFEEPHYHRPDRPLDRHLVSPVLKINDFGLSRYYSPEAYQKV